MTDLDQILKNFEGWMEYKKTFSYSTKRKYVKIVRLFLIRTGLKFNVSTINAFLTDSNRVNNCSNYKYAIKAFLESIGRKDLALDLKVIKRKGRKKVFRHVPKEEMKTIVNMLPNSFKVLALFQLKSGCRFIESVTCRAENFDFNYHADVFAVTIGAGFSQTKGDKERKVFLSKNYEKYFRVLMKKPYGYLFLPEKCESMDEVKLFNFTENVKRYYNNELTKAARHVGIQTFSSHELRHQFADNFINAGGTLEQLRAMLGHVRIDTTLAYVSISERQGIDVIKNIG